MNEDSGYRPFRITTTATDAYVADATSKVILVVKAKLIAGGAAATAQLTDQNGTVLAELSAPVNGADWQDVPVRAEGKVRVNTLTGAGAVCMVYVN